jgi:26S proteasome non-ATPase regulatory subunit 9
MAEPLPRPAEVPPTSLPLPDPEAYEGEPREYARALMQRENDIDTEIVRHIGQV